MKDKNYTEEFKANAVRMVLVDGLTRTEVGRRLETSSKNICRWVKENQKDLNSDGESKSSLKKKNQELEKQVRQLQMERDILKKATAFFARELL